MNDNLDLKDRHPASDRISEKSNLGYSGEGINGQGKDGFLLRRGSRTLISYLIFFFHLKHKGAERRNGRQVINSNHCKRKKNFFRVLSRFECSKTG